MLKRALRSGAVAATLLAMVGCGGEGASPLSMITGATNSEKSEGPAAGGGGATSDDKVIASNIGTAQPSTTLRFASEPAYAAGPGNARDMIIIRDDKIEAYLQRIVRNMLAHWRGPEPKRIGVFVYASAEMNAQARPHGDIYVSSAAFNRFKSEDELALLLGHELGHILLGHHENNKTARQVAQVAEIGMMVAIGAAYARNSTMRRVGDTREIMLTNQGAFVSQSGRSLAAALAVKTLSSDIALHAFSRHQEYAADRFSVEIARRAGYDPTAMNDIIDGFRAQHAAAEKRRQSTEQAMPTSIGAAFSMALSDVTKSVLSDHPNPDDRDKSLKTMFASSGVAKMDPVPRRTAPYAAAVNGGRFARLRTLFHTLIDASEAAREGNTARTAALLKEAERYLRDASPDARLMMFAALQSQGDNEQAYRVLSGASPRDKGTVDFYRVLAQEHLLRGKHGESRVALDRGDRDLGNPPGLLPAKINLARTTGDTAALQAHLATCQAQKDEGLLKVCQAATTGADPEEEFKKSGGLLSMLSGSGGTGGGSVLGAASSPASSIANTIGSGASTFGNILGGILKQ